MDDAVPTTMPDGTPMTLFDRLLGGRTDTRTRDVAASVLTLSVLAALVALLVPASQSSHLDAGALVTTAVLLAAPVAFWLSFLLVRAGWAWTGAGASLMTGATASLVVAFVQPQWMAWASVGFMLASVLVLASLFLPYPIAAALALLNAVGATAMPRFLPEAGSATLEVPYVFLGVNVLLFIVYAAVRQRELERLHRTQEHLQEERHRVHELEVASGAMVDQHEQEVQDLQRRHHDQQAFLSAASHELRTPLTPIMIQLSLLRGDDDEGLSPAQARHLDIIERNLDRLGILVSDLLDVARLGSGKVVIDAEDIDLETLLRDSVDSFQDQARHKDLRIDLVVHGPLPVEADPVRVSQVLYNLLSNAVKFTPRGGNVSVLAHRDLDGTYVGVQDSGVGLSAEQRARLFLPFGQVHKDADGAGTGLGLYISQGILAQHGGRIWVDSAGHGTGSTFSFWLPQKAMPPGNGIPDGPLPEAS